MSRSVGSSETAATTRRRSVDRGQTVIDYTIGISVFLLVVAFVFAFAPSLTTPFTGDSTDAVVVSDRAVDRLAHDLLVDDPARPTVLNATCTEAFFDTDGPDLSGSCRYDADASDLKGALAVGSPVRTVNVTVVDGAGTVALNGTTLVAGPAPPRSADVAVSQRAVLLDGRDATIVVRVW